MLSHPDVEVDTWAKLRPVLLLTTLPPLTSLGEWLDGGLWGPSIINSLLSHWLADSSGRGVGSLSEPDPTSVVLVASPDFDSTLSLLGAFLFFLVLFAIGSKVIIRASGAIIGPISTVSTRDTLRSHVDVVAIEVGRVIVELIRYVIVPLSN